MDTILVTVTGLSLLMAVAMGLMLTRVLREERRRSEARVALLNELAAEPSTPADRVPLHPAAMLSSELFQTQPEPSPWPRRLAAIGGVAVFVGAVAIGWRAAAPSAEVAGRPSTPAAVRVQPLELLSLRHLHENRVLTITGLVQNPRSSISLERIEATVLTFDRDGALLASGRAPLDYLRLVPGDESPFVIRLPVEGVVARYRIGFRAADGSVLSHVDRRHSESIARKETP